LNWFSKLIGFFAALARLRKNAGVDLYVTADPSTLRVRVTIGGRGLVEVPFEKINVFLGRLTWQNNAGREVRARVDYLPSVNALALTVSPVDNLVEVLDRYVAGIEAINAALDRRGL
jgi:hypothetical protein